MSLQPLQSGTAAASGPAIKKVGGFFGNFGYGLLFLLLGALLLYLIYKMRKLESDLYECKSSQYNDRDAERVFQHAIRDQKNLDFVRDTLYEMDEKELTALELEENNPSEQHRTIINPQDHLSQNHPNQHQCQNIPNNPQFVDAIFGGLMPGMKLNFPSPGSVPSPMNFPSPSNESNINLNPATIEEILTDDENPSPDDLTNGNSLNRESLTGRRVHFEDIDGNSDEDDLGTCTIGEECEVERN